MIETVWPYLAVMLLAAGLFPSLEKRYRLAVVLGAAADRADLSVRHRVGRRSACGRPRRRYQSAQRALTAHLLPALLFLLMVTCDLRAILRVGPRVLAVFACAMGSILVAIVSCYLLFRNVLPAGRLEDARRAERHLDRRLGQPGRGEAVDRACPTTCCRRCCWPMRCAIRCGCWCCSRAARSRRASIVGLAPTARPYPELAAPTTEPADSGRHSAVAGHRAGRSALGAARLAASLPVSTMLTTTSWTVLIATARRADHCSHAARKNSRAGAARQCPARNARGGARVAEQLRRHGVRAAVHSVRSARAGDSHRAARARGAHRFASTFSCAASRRWRRSAASPPRRCSPRRTRRYWSRSQCCSPCSD